MKFKDFFSRYGAYIVGLLLFFALGYGYCFPQLEGKKVSADDSIKGTCAVQEGVRYAKDTGDHTWWTGSMFSGMPNYQIGGGRYKSSALLRPFDRILHKGHSDAAWVLILYFISFFVLLRSFDTDKWLSVIGAIAIGLSSYFLIIIAAGHNGKTSTIALMSVVFAGLNFIFKGRYGLGVVLTMLFSAIGYSTHPQMAYYIFMMMGMCILCYGVAAVREKSFKDFLKKLAVFVGAVTIGLGTGTSSVFANREYAQETIRGGHSEIVKDSEANTLSKGLDIEYATRWSYGIDETMSLMIPGVMGGASTLNVGTDSDLYKLLVKKGVPRKSAADFCESVPMYWGEQPFTAGNVYVGAVICFLFLLGLMIVKGPAKWALLFSTLLSIALAWGSNFMGLTEFFFKYFPLYNKFRAVSSILIVAEIAMPVLGFLAIREMISGSVPKDKAIKDIIIAGGITGGICLVFALAGGLMFDFQSTYDASMTKSLPGWLYTGIINERAALLKADSWRSFFFIVGGTATLWLYAKGFLNKAWMIVILGALCTSDLWSVDKRYFNDSSWVKARDNEKAYAMLPYEAELLKDKSHFRVFNTTTSTWNDARTSYYLKSIGGYHAAKLRRYQDLIIEHLSKGHLPVINMLNTKYLIVNDGKGSPYAVLNPDAMGNAWFVEDFKVVGSPNEESAALMEVDLTRTAVVSDKFKDAIRSMSPGISPDARITLTQYTPKELFYDCSSPTPASVVFSEIYYPYGWKSYIDGKPVPHYRVNYVLRGMDVPAGEHSIHFIFDPDSVRKGDTIAIIFIVLMYGISLAIIAGSIIRRRRKND